VVLGKIKCEDVGVDVGSRAQNIFGRGGREPIGGSDWREIVGLWPAERWTLRLPLSHHRDMSGTWKTRHTQSLKTSSIELLKLHVEIGDFSFPFIQAMMILSS
jgi:hypothetical protein